MSRRGTSTLRQRRAGGRAPSATPTASDKALSDAERDDLVISNVCKLQKAPKVGDSEMVIVQDVPGLVAKLRGFRLYVPAMIALFTGMRLGEVLALRWSRVDLDGKVVSGPRSAGTDEGGHSASRCRRPRPAAATSPCPICWSRRCASIVGRGSKFANAARRRPLAGRCVAVRQPRRANRSSQATCHRTGASLRGASACRT